MTELAQFVGRFHPLLVHFPIGILVLACGVQALAWWRSRRAAGTRTGGARSPLDGVVTLMLAVGAAGAVLSATTGYLLGTSGGYGGDIYARHELLGISVAVIACGAAVVAWLRERRPNALWRRAHAGLLAMLLIALTVAGHLGATLTHGEDYLTEHAPAPVRAMLARIGAGGGAASAAAAAPVRADQALVFASLVQPVLQARCVSCHGAAKAEGRLRLDTPEGLKKGGEDGAAIVAGRAASSDLVRRIWLPASHKDVMPPRGQRPLTPAEASLVRWWIDQGAKFDQKLADTEIAPEVLPAIEAALGPVRRGGPTLPAVSVAAADPAALVKVRQLGVSVMPLAADTPFLHVHCTNVRATFGDEQLRALEPIAPQVIWLDVSGTRITDAGLAAVARFPNLTRLHLDGTAITDAGLGQIARLEHLEYLNLYGTHITDGGLTPLANLKNLRALYVWHTAVTSEGVTRLKAALPRVAVQAGTAPGGAPGAVPAGT